MVEQGVIDLNASIRALAVNPSEASSTLNDIQIALNDLFGPDANCKQVLYTENTDKMFFGICVMPIIPAKEIINILKGDDRYIISEYYVELDSKMFDTGLGLTFEEIGAIVTHDVGRVVTDATPIEEVKRNIDDYLLKQNDTIKLTESVHYIEILSYGIRDAIRKVTSVFEAEEGKIITEFDIGCMIDRVLTSAMNKIAGNGYNWNSDIDNKLIFLTWVMRLYKDVLCNRIDAIRTLKDGIEMSASKLEKKEMDNIIRRLERIDDDVLLEGFMDDIIQGFSRTSKSMKLKGIQSYEDDYYEIEFNVNNMETQDDAVLLLHKINSRMSVIDDFLTSEELDKANYKKWSDLYSKYNKLRGDIAKNKIYQNKTRLYVNYGGND